MSEVMLRYRICIAADVFQYLFGTLFTQIPSIMNFEILDFPDTLFKRMNAVPIECAKFVKPFGRPKSFYSPYLDIVHQYLDFGSFKLRVMTFNAKCELTLNAIVNRSRLALLNMLYGKLIFRIPSGSNIPLTIDTYTFSCLNVWDLSFILDVGYSSLVSIEFDEGFVQKKRNDSSVVDHWLHSLVNNESQLYWANIDIDGLPELVKQVSGRTVETRIQKEIVGLKLNEIFLTLVDATMKSLV